VRLHTGRHGRGRSLTTVGLHVTDLPTPALVLDEIAVEHNVAAMATWTRARDVLLAPHGKTTMCAPLFRRQLEVGAWGMTAADIRGADLAVEAGAPVVLIANELANPGDYDWIAGARERGTRVLFCVDSITSLEAAESAHRRLGGPAFEALLEVGYEGGRCGVRTLDEAVRLADAMTASAAVALAGVEAFEGLLPDVVAVDGFLDQVGDVAEAVASRLQDTRLLTCGGSSYFDRAVSLLGPRARASGFSFVLRSGCYVTHDHGLYAERTPAARDVNDAPRFMSAITVRTTVLSRPEQTRAIVNAGRRHVSYDAGLPIALHVERKGAILIDEPAPVVVQLNDQHAHLEVSEEASLQVGDVVVLGISHPCTAIDRWRVIPLIGAAGAVVEALPTSF
jgi:D-serine dehydratase